MNAQCFCGQAISFRGRRTTGRCPVCHAEWRKEHGVWVEGLVGLDSTAIIFTPDFMEKRRVVMKEITCKREVLEAQVGTYEDGSAMVLGDEYSLKPIGGKVDIYA